MSLALPCLQSRLQRMRPVDPSVALQRAGVALALV